MTFVLKLFVSFFIEETLLPVHPTHVMKAHSILPGGHPAGEGSRSERRTVKVTCPKFPQKHE